MNAKSAAPGELHPTLSISRQQLAKCFREHGGQTKVPCTRPLLSDSRKAERCEWVNQNRFLFSGKYVPVAFLDEKWFYTTCRRKLMKVLPREESELSPVVYKRPQMRNRRFPIKVMYLGVVACPVEEHGFDGKVFLKRVSKRKTVARASRNKNFCADSNVNNSLSFT